MSLTLELPGKREKEGATEDPDLQYIGWFSFLGRLGKRTDTCVFQTTKPSDVPMTYFSLELQRHYIRSVSFDNHLGQVFKFDNVSLFAF